jgi:hypothetical protein
MAGRGRHAHPLFVMLAAALPPSSAARTLHRHGQGDPGRGEHGEGNGRAVTFASKSLTEHLVHGTLGLTPFVVFAAIGISLPSCGHDRVTVNQRMFLREGGRLKYQGGGCSSMELGGSSPAPAPMKGSDFQTTESQDGDVVVEQVFSDTELLASRRYDAAFLNSAKVDQVMVKTHAGKDYVLRYWGGSCAPLDAGIDGGSGG